MYGLIGKIKVVPGQRDTPIAIARGRPLIAGFGERFETHPIGGHGLPPRR